MMPNQEERLARWFSDSPAGRYASAAEQKFFRARAHPRHGLTAALTLCSALFGGEDDIGLLFVGGSGRVHIRCTLPAVPLADASVQTLLLPHGLELCCRRNELLDECFRILSPDGRLLLSGFNPLSPCRLIRLWRTADTGRHALTPHQSRRLLREHRFSPQETWFSARSADTAQAPRWLQTLDHTLPAAASALYGITAVKRLAPLTPIYETQNGQNATPQLAFAATAYETGTPPHRACLIHGDIP